MKKIFLLLFLSLTISPLCAQDDDDFDIDKWLEKWGISTDEQTDKQADEPAPTDIDTTPARTKKDVKKKKQTIDVDTFNKKLTKLRDLVDEMKKDTRDVNLFSDQDFQEQASIYIQGIAQATTPAQAKRVLDASKKLDDLEDVKQDEKTEEDFFVATENIFGTDGLIVLLSTVLSKEIYQLALTYEKYASIPGSIDSKIDELTVLKEKVDEYEKTLESMSEEQKLKLYAEISETEKLPPELQELLDTQRDLQAELLTAHENLEPLTKAIKKVFTDKEVQDIIREKRKKRDQGQPIGRFPSYEREPGDYDREPSYDGRDRDNYERDNYGMEDYDYDYNPPYDQDVATEAEPEKEKEKERLQRIGKKKKDKTKEELEKEKTKREEEEKRKLKRAEYGSLLKKATELISSICKPVNENGLVIDQALSLALKNGHDKITTLQKVVAEINEREGKGILEVPGKKIDTKQVKEKELSEEEKEDEVQEKGAKAVKKEKKKLTKEKLVRTEKIKDEEKLEEERIGREKKSFEKAVNEQKKYLQAILNNIEKLIILCKHGYAELYEKADGRWAIREGIDSKVLESQKILRETYPMLKNSFPNKKEFEQKETSFRNTLFTQIKNEIKKDFGTFRASANEMDITKTFLELSASGLTKARKALLNTLKFVKSANNAPLSFEIQTQDIGTQEDIDLLRKKHRFVAGKFSESLQKLIFERQIKRAKDVLKKRGKPVPETLDNNAAYNILQDNLRVLEVKGQELMKEDKETRKEKRQRKKEEKKLGKAGKKAESPEKSLERTVQENVNDIRSQIFPLLSPEKNTEWKNFMSLKKIAIRKKVRKAKKEKKSVLEELRETYQFEKTPKIMNEIDQMRAILDAISRDTNLWALGKKSKYNVEITDALWAWGDKVKNPQMCDVRTGIWQEIVNETLDQLKAEQISKDKKKKFILPKKINTKTSADLSSLSNNEKLSNRLGKRFARSFKQFATKIKRAFTKGAAERSLEITYTVNGKKYLSTFKPEKNVVLDSSSKKGDAGKQAQKARK